MNGALKIFYFFPVLIHNQTFIFPQKQYIYIYHGCERQQSHASPHEQVLSHEHQNGSNTDIMIVHKTLTPLFGCKSMLLGYLLRHKVQIYAISKRPYSLLCAGPQGEHSQQSLSQSSTAQANQCGWDDFNHSAGLRWHVMTR